MKPPGGRDALSPQVVIFYIVAENAGDVKCFVEKNGKIHFAGNRVFDSVNKKQSSVHFELCRRLMCVIIPMHPEVQEGRLV